MPVATLVTVIGPGLVGSALLRQLHAHGARHGVRVVGVANSKRMMLLPLDAGSDAAGTTLSAASLDDGGAAVATDFAALTAHMAAGAAALGAVPVVCDCTSSTAVAAAYPAMLAAGVSVCTPNKKAFSGDESLFAEVTRDAAAGECRGLCRHEATVGAGLPVLSSLADLIATGDKIVKVQGVLSGTISYLLNSFSPSAGSCTKSWSELVSGAKAQGFTEPDPRDDLDGSDFARKVVILARVCGARGPSVSLAGVRVESLVPADLDDRAAVPTDSFLARLADHDAAMAERQRLAAADGRVLRMIGEVDLSDPAKPVASVALAAVEPSHPFAGLAGSDNVVAVSTERYSAAPLVIRGAGAGAEVTAHGVFRDVIEVSRTIRL